MNFSGELYFPSGICVMSHIIKHDMDPNSNINYSRKIRLEIQANIWWMSSLWDCLGDIFLERCSKELLQLGSLCPTNYRLTVANYAIFTRPRDSFFFFGFFPFKYAMFFVCSTPKEVFSHSDKTCFLFEMTIF